ncbi:hypothetical protein EJ08DRAFT_665063 [Tothia fuscella]|uniref:Zn(2)-C6 fungal-type domain-containing protein n=1 Tax=Tothia fuscella TaxID=1048955 RepID=A0A9P4TT50_9PEZI|nr:hypothetical protein EJ08DRAFT_665063 [Tothia fuscella]
MEYSDGQRSSVVISGGVNPVSETTLPNITDKHWRCSRAQSKHVLYCRKKHKSGPYSRRKACDECVRSKVPCSTEPGGCARYASRKVSCNYRDIPKRNNPANENDGGDTALVASSEIALVSSTNDPPRSMEDLRSSVDEIAHEDLGIYSNSTTSLANLGWRCTLNPDWSQVSDLTTTSVEGQSLGLPLGTSSIDDNFDSTFSAASSLEYSFQFLRTIPSSPVYREPSSLFERLNQDSVPPFIHPKYQSLSGDDAAQPSPLSAALNLARMLLHGRRNFLITLAI